MIQTYQGYFLEDGRFIPDSLLAKIPVKRRAIVNILDDEVIEQTRPNKVDDIKKILAAAQASEDGLTNADWNEMNNLRSRTNTGLSRTVSL